MRSRRQLAVAVLGSLVLHALLFLELPRLSASIKSGSRESAPIQVTLIGTERKQAVIPQAAAEQGLQPGPRERLPALVSAPQLEGIQTKVPSTSATKSAPVVISAATAQSAPNFRSGTELDPPPRPLGDINPEYPPDAGLQQGTVVLRLMIDSSGDVEDVVVLSATPEGLFETSAIAAFGKAKFSPGRYLGIPVRSQITIAVDYTPTDRGSAVSGQGVAIGAKR